MAIHNIQNMSPTWIFRVHPIGTLFAAGKDVDTGIGGPECSRALGSPTARFRHEGGDAKTPMLLQTRDFDGVSMG